MPQRNRTQVDYSPGQASLESAVGASAGNYQVAVAPTPKTNLALQFSAALNQLPNLAGQYTNYMNRVAQEKLALMTEDELLKELAGGDKETLNILQYNKAYNYGLVEKNFKRNLEGYQKQYDDLASQIESYPDSDAFEGALNNLDETVVSQFLSNTANEYQRKAGEALLFSTMPTLRAKSLVKYQAYKQDATIHIIQSTIHDEVLMNRDRLPAGELLDFGLRKFKNSLNFPDLTPSDKSRLMEQFVYGLVSRYEAIGGVQDAVSVLDAASVFEIYPGAKLGSIGDNATQFERLRANLLDVDEAKGEKIQANRIRAQANAEALFHSVLDPLTEGEWEKKVKDYVRSIGTYESEEWVEERAAEIASSVLEQKTNFGKLSALSLSLSGLTDSTNHQDTIGLINASANQYEKAKNEWNDSDSLYGPDLEEVQGQIAAQLQGNSLLKREEANDVVLQDGLKRVSKSSKAWDEAWKAEVAKLPYRKVEGLEDHYGLLVKEIITEDDFEESAGTTAQTLSQYLMDHDRNLALYQKAQGDEVEFKRLLREEAIKEKERLQEIYDLNVEFQNSITNTVEADDLGVLNDRMAAALKEEVQEDAKRTWFGVFKTKTTPFTSLSEDFDGNREVALKDREDIFNLLTDPNQNLGAKKTSVRNALLYNIHTYGVDSLEEFDNEQFQAANAGSKGRVALATVKIGQAFKDSLENALIYTRAVTGEISVSKKDLEEAKKAYDMVLDKLYADTGEEIERIIKILAKQ